MNIFFYHRKDIAVLGNFITPSNLEALYPHEKNFPLGKNDLLKTASIRLKNKKYEMSSKGERIMKLLKTVILKNNNN